MKKKLTYRQQQFLGKFLDIYQEMAHPVHYITVAEKLGVGKVTAYEMLRLLEEQDLVKAEYQTNPDQHGPGRSVVRFYPTKEGHKLIQSMSGGYDIDQDWENARAQILIQLKEGKAAGYEDLLSNLLARIPEQRSPLIFATELITTIILTLASIKDTPGIQSLLDQLSRVGLPREMGLTVMSGISMFLSILEKGNRRSTNLILSQMIKYDKVISELNEESRKKISDYLREIIQIVSV